MAYLVTHRTRKTNVNYLDDFSFAAMLKSMCDMQVQIFLDICKDIGFSVALEKTCWGTNLLTFLGLLLDTLNQVVCIPIEKIKKAVDMVEFFLNKRNKKATVIQFQRLCGVLNFLCSCLVPGRAFVTRLYPPGHLKQHYHVKITQENRMDLEVWKTFLTYPKVFNRPFMDFKQLSAVEIDMYSDASRNFDLGVGAYCGSEWTVMKWNMEFMEHAQPSIQYLEMFGVAIAVLNWIKLSVHRQ